ncbi:hypothetical protein MB46_14020 [Arthrobacter alpinus]|uniref:hypothetical protein n=1 Tax=Arthrobacter alpinus TaxID=656366 RepID=UPI0005CA8798|nr:hypothetical protein [Arthrobacter alpinus]ALV46435.1 hypothetical protein MB46_14020 [Arthrobacter alpinus]
MSQDKSTDPNPATRSRVAKKTVGTTMAAVTLAAAAVLAGPGIAGASASSLDPDSIIGSPPNSVSSRIAGVQEDLDRAVALHQVTAEQAAFLQRQLVKRIQDDV